MGEQKVTKCLTAPIGKQRAKKRREERYTSDSVSPPRQDGVTQSSPDCSLFDAECTVRM